MVLMHGTARKDHREWLAYHSHYTAEKLRPTAVTEVGSLRSQSRKQTCWLRGRQCGNLIMISFAWYNLILSVLVLCF